MTKLEMVANLNKSAAAAIEAAEWCFMGDKWQAGYKWLDIAQVCLQQAFLVNPLRELGQ